MASISWMNRQLARAIFAAPPVSSYEEVRAVVVRLHLVVILIGFF